MCPLPTPFYRRTTMKRFAVTICASLALMGCSVFSGNVTPRTQSMDLMMMYEPIQIGVEIAVGTEWVQNHPTVKASLQKSSSVATDAVLAFHRVTRGCVRDPDTGTIIIVEGLECEPDQAARLITVAIDAVSSLGRELSSANEQMGEVE